MKISFSLRLERFFFLLPRCHRQIHLFSSSLIFKTRAAYYILFYFSAVSFFSLPFSSTHKRPAEATGTRDLRSQRMGQKSLLYCILLSFRDAQNHPLLELPHFIRPSSFSSMIQNWKKKTAAAKAASFPLIGARDQI
jgi:hypothetical protein